MNREEDIDKSERDSALMEDTWLCPAGTAGFELVYASTINGTTDGHTYIFALPAQ
jgi:hypothetical protein